VLHACCITCLLPPPLDPNRNGPVETKGEKEKDKLVRAKASCSWWWMHKKKGTCAPKLHAQKKGTHLLQSDLCFIFCILTCFFSHFATCTIASRLLADRSSTFGPTLLGGVIAIQIGPLDRNQLPYSQLQSDTITARRSGCPPSGRLMGRSLQSTAKDLDGVVWAENKTSDSHIIHH